MDFANMTWGEAVEHAKAKSGLTNQDIALRLTTIMRRETPILSSTVQRWFNPHDDYWPSSSLNPYLCKVLGNNILVEWQVAKLIDDCTTGEEPTIQDVHACLPDIWSEFGKVGSAVHESLSDGVITPREARTMRGAVHKFIDRLKRFKTMLGPLAAKTLKRAG